MKIFLALPCYNCELQIGRVLEEIDRILPDNPEIKDVCIIDNQSLDSSIDQAIKAIQNLSHRSVFSVYRNFSNVGLGGTHKVAYTLAAKSNFSHLMILHGDHQATALDINKLIRESRSTERHVSVLGARFLNLNLLQGYSYIRIVGNLVLNCLYSVVTRRRVYDLGSGLNLFSLQDIEEHKLMAFDNGFTFNMDLLLSLIDRKINFRYVPIQWSTTDQVSNARAVKVGWKTLIKLGNWILNKKNVNTSDTRTELVFKG